MSLIVFIIILAILVLVHELGHFIAAKKNGILVEEFGFGYPPRIFGIRIGETLYSLNLVPLGGFVKLYGEEYQEKVNKKLASKSFVSKKPSQKALVIVAGIIGNFLLGWVLISYLFTQGVPAPTNKVIIERVTKDSPAAKAGLEKKDVISKVILPDRDRPVDLTSPTELIDYSGKYGGKQLTFIVTRKNKTLTIKIIPRNKPPAGQGPLGIVITSFEEKKYSWYQAPFYGLVEAFSITKKIAVELMKTVVQFLSFKKPSVEVSGPIGIAYYTGQVIKFGKNAVLELIALLSLNLAIINLLPFPALDGGRLALVIYEWITGMRVNKNFEKYLNLAGFIFLLSLAALISINDIIKLTK